MIWKSHWTHLHHVPWMIVMVGWQIVSVPNTRVKWWLMKCWRHHWKPYTIPCLKKKRALSTPKTVIAPPTWANLRSKIEFRKKKLHFRMNFAMRLPPLRYATESKEAESPINIRLYAKPYPKSAMSTLIWLNLRLKLVVGNFFYATSERILFWSHPLLGRQLNSKEAYGHPPQGWICVQKLLRTCLILCHFRRAFPEINPS